MKAVSRSQLYVVVSFIIPAKLKHLLWRKATVPASPLPLGSTPYY